MKSLLPFVLYNCEMARHQKCMLVLHYFILHYEGGWGEVELCLQNISYANLNSSSVDVSTVSDKIDVQRFSRKAVMLWRLWNSECRIHH